VDGSEFGRYRLERLIGSGGMGDVYQAVDTERDRVVALKLLPPLFSGSAEFQERFRRESRVAARLRDPHIIPIHDFGEIDSRLYIDMRLVDSGRTVATLLREEGALPPERAVHLVGQIAEALDAAHGDGLIHRDVKPSNVLITDRDFVYVMDFGIAHSVGQTAFGLTMSGSTVGTIDYMAPERFTNGPIDTGVDVYALGCLLYQCLTGRTPFEGSEAPALMYAHVHVAPPRPSAAVPGLPDALDEVVVTAMAKDPADRYATTGELGDAARAALGGTMTAPPRAVPTTERATVVTPRSTRPEVETGDDPPTGPAVDPPADPPTEQQSPAPAPVPVSEADGAAPPEDTRTGDTRSDVRAWATRPGSQGIVVLAGSAVVVLALLAVLLVALRGGDDPGTGAVGAPAGAVVAAASSGTAEVVGSVPTPATPGSLTVAPGGRVAYVANRDPRVVTVVDLAAGAAIDTIPVPAAPPRFIAFSVDGGRAYISAYTDDDAVNVVQVVDTATRDVVAVVPVDRRPYALAAAPDGRTVWVPSHDDATIDLLDTATNTITGRLPVAANPHWVSFSADRAYVANHESNLVTVMDAGTGATLATVPVGVSPHALAPSPDGARVAVANYDDASVSIIDTATDQVVATPVVGAGPQYVSYAADGRHLYTANVRDGTVSVVDTATSRTTATVPVCSSPTSVVMAPPANSTARVTCLDEARLALLGIGG
jgi:YVTN family beta-propeller protein